MPEETRISPFALVLLGFLGMAGVAGLALAFLRKKPGEEPPEPPEPPAPGQANLYGLVTDNETGEPVPGASITVYQDISPTQTKIYETTTSQWGYYEILGMVANVSADMVISAGGYHTYTKEGISIPEGNVELNIFLIWAGGPRQVPRYVSHGFSPLPIPSGGEFKAAMTAWLPVVKTMNHRYTLQLRLEETEPAGYRPASMNITWRVVHQNLYNALDPTWREEKGYIPYTQEGKVSVESWQIAEYKAGRMPQIEILPLPPGTYALAYIVTRDYVEVSGIGRLRVYSSDHPDFYEARGEVGTVEVA